MNFDRGGMNFSDDEFRALCERHGILRLRLFGSMARGDSTARSDVDLLVDFDGRKGLWELVRIERELSEFLGKPVDLITERALSPYLRERIVRDARVVYERAA
jgi:uncharacterized protein